MVAWFMNKITCIERGGWKKCLFEKEREIERVFAFL